MRDIAHLPLTLPIFPLAGVLLLPGSDLRLNIFEPRYLAMVDDVMRDHRLIGMIQPRDTTTEAVYQTGCAGRIYEYRETDDGRYLITLKGVQRFHVGAEIACMRGYRLLSPHWAPYEVDQIPPTMAVGLDRSRLIQLLRPYFARLGVEADWAVIKEAPPATLINNLAMACPFESGEKQALLEAKTIADRGEVLLALLEMATVPASTDQRPQ